MGKSIKSIPVRLEPKIWYNLQEAADQAAVFTAKVLGVKVLGVEKPKI